MQTDTLSNESETPVCVLPRVMPSFLVGKSILDACCGSKMIWKNKHHPGVLYIDNRNGEFISSNGYKNIIEPDIVADFRKLPFENETFNLVVFDPPHRSDLGKNSWMENQYGRLFPTWETDLKSGFDECMRVLKFNGVLIFKWNEKQIKTSKIISIIGVEPLFGNLSGKGGKTIWMIFMKEVSCNEA